MTASPQDAAGTATAALPDIPMKIGATTYQLRFGVRAILALQRKWALSDQNEVRAKIAAESKNLETMIDVVWAALQTHHRELTPEDVLDFLDGGDLGEMVTALGQAMEAASPPQPDRPQ